MWKGQHQEPALHDSDSEPQFLPRGCGPSGLRLYMGRGESMTSQLMGGKNSTVKTEHEEEGYAKYGKQIGLCWQGRGTGKTRLRTTSRGVG